MSPPRRAAAAPEPTTSVREPSGDARPVDVGRRVLRLRQWAEGASPLGVRLPALPSWAEEATRRGSDGAAWIEVVRGVERMAQQKVVAALETWEGATRTRLARLEAYSVDSRLERDQIDDVLHAARQGEITQALQTFQQVDRVVALKERHLDQARDELERIVSLLRDMDALSLAPPTDADATAEELEGELRGGHLAPLKQKLRALRLQSVSRLQSELPPYVAEYGSFLLREKADGLSIDLESLELARAARAFQEGRPEEALRRLRLLQQVHGSGGARNATRARAADGAPTGSSREA